MPSNVFSRALSGIFLTQISQNGIYKAADGNEYPIRVIVSQPDEIIGFSGNSLIDEKITIEILTNQSFDVKKGEIISIDGDEYSIQSEPKADDMRLIYKLDCIRA